MWSSSAVLAKLVVKKNDGNFLNAVDWEHVSQGLNVMRSLIL